MATRQHATDSDDAGDYFRRGQGIGSRTVAVRTDALGSEPFDEELPAREDPHLWTRLLHECDGIHIDEPLATKRRRDDSLTSDPKRVLDAERAAIADLCERYPEFREFRDERQAEAWFRYARALLRDGEAGHANAVATALLRAARYPQWDVDRDYRMWACWAVSKLPERVAPRVWELLERAQEVLK